MIVDLFAGQTAHPADVGGKAASLMRMRQAHLPVPAGAVITSAFFAPWLEAISDSDAADASSVRERAIALPLNLAQRDALERLRQLLPHEAKSVYAVRSSAAEEDAAEASFAGLFETRLGVRKDDLECAVRCCFAASLDERVIAYKRQRGIGVHASRFAVVVQQQIDSDVSGVAFSVNPLTNDHDEAVIAASWGLGTTVVDGRITPDQFVVDKPTGRLIEETRGDKHLSVRLAHTGGVVDCAEPRAADRALTDAQIQELTALVVSIETLYAAPVDIEWAYAGGTLHVLQARPITTYVPLHESMLTPPGAQRRLYLDAALSKGMTSNKPFSPLGHDQMERSFRGLIETWLGAVGRLDEPAGPIFFAGARMYVNLSDVLRFASPRTLAKSHAPTDTLTATTLANVDARRYRSATRPPWLRIALLWRIPRAMWRVRRLFWYVLKAFAAPNAMHRTYERTATSLIADLRVFLKDDRPLDALQHAMTARMAGTFDALMAALLVGQLSPRLAIGRKASSSKDTLMATLSRGTSGNVVVDMSVALQRAAGALEPGDFEDLSALIARLERRDAPDAFLREWDEFVETYGWRGPNEMDVASGRYGDDPALAVGQMASLARAGGLDLAASHARFAEERHRAYATLAQDLGPVRRFLLRRVEQMTRLFAGSRDTPKHVNVLCNYVIRQRARREGERLVAAGRLDAAQDVFDLTFDDLQAAIADPALDLRRLGEERSRFAGRLRTQVRTFPPIIDSRGRILRAPVRHGEPGTHYGMAVSPGVVRGPVKVLRTAEGARISPGEILVAYTTDPGWTPLFVNAAAVVLEVGGVLQHGAVVAREFGKPCVVGIAGVVESLRDGDRVEVDGANGTVRRVLS